MKTTALVFGVIMLMAQAVMAATFPVAKESTVSADGNGNITVNAPGEFDWVLVQFCQDSLRAGCGNNQLIQASENSNGVMKFHLEEGGVKSGQVAFNFRRKSDRKWLAIPDCRVKPLGKLALGMSYETPNIAESGGAHFVYTGSGLPVDAPIDWEKMCSQKEQAVQAVSNAGKRSESSGGGNGQSQRVNHSSDSQNVQTKQKAKQKTHVKGDNNVVNKRIVQQSSTINNKGATVTVKGSVSGRDCKDAKKSKDCVPGVDASTTNNTFSLISFGEGKKEGEKDVKDCVTVVDGKVSYNCNDTATTSTTPK